MVFEFVSMPLHPQPAPPPLNPHLISRILKHPSWTECQMTAGPPDGLRLIQFALSPNRTTETLLHADFFGQEFCAASAFGELLTRKIPGPVTSLLLNEELVGGVQISTVSNVQTTPLYDEQRIIGRFFEDADAKYCYLGDIQPPNSSASQSDQAAAVMETIQSTLEKAGMHFKDVVRTWFYVDQILDWYDGFNRIRTSFFERHGIMRMPASTGIGCPNASGKALVAKAVAVLPKNGNVRIHRSHSPLQCEAADYGSSFSRAMEVCDSTTRTLYVSGTASIEPDGRTVYAGNTALQIGKTMEVVEALLARSGMTLPDTTRAIAYFRHREDFPLWLEYCRNRHLPRLPILLVPSDICREDLLFEIELDASVKA
jgi:enamine deaminase RidA (YjgF/YER057c/UK114 family)